MDRIRGIIFDLDGVIVSTDDCHYKAWKRLADEEDICFDHRINERLRGVSRRASLDIILENSGRPYSDGEKDSLAERKNRYYRELIQSLSEKDILPGIKGLLDYYRSQGLKLAIGSSSKNAPLILDRIKLHDSFDAVIDGNALEKSKPDPEVFLKGARALSLTPQECLVYEDADAGVEAARRGGFPVIRVG